MVKVTAIFLILVQLSGLLATGICPAENTSSPEPFVVQLDSLSSILILMKSELSQQARMALQAACLASEFAQKKEESVPVPRENTGRSHPSLQAILIQSLDGFRYEQCRNEYSAVAEAVPKLSETLIVFFLTILLCFLILDRLRIFKYFYLLPRGSIDEAIISKSRMAVLDPSLSLQQ